MTILYKDKPQIEMKRTIFLNDFSPYYPVGTKVYF